MADKTRNTGSPGSPGLARLHDLSDYKVADGDPDIRSWHVKTADGRKIGKVHDLIVDTSAMKVRYMDVELDRNELSLDKDRHILIPIGGARLDDEHDDVRLSTVGAAELLSAPAYDHGALSTDLEDRTRAAFGGRTFTGQRDSFYEDDLYNESGFWGNCRATRGEATYIIYHRG